MTDHFDKRANQPKLPEGCKVSPEELNAMTPVELAEGMERVLDAMTEETYDPALIDAYLDALDCKTPVPAAPDAQRAFAGFQRRIHSGFPERRTSTQKFLRPRRLRRTLLVAAALALFILGSMIAGQAAGKDVFGPMARWTEEEFSFGTFWSLAPQDPNLTRREPKQPLNEKPHAAEGEQSYSSLQEVLDAYHITEVAAPAWIPEGYALEQISVTDVDDPEILAIFADYRSPDQSSSIGIQIMWYEEEPLTSVEKVNKPPELFEVNGQTFYLIENEASYTAAWVTERFECYLSGTLEQKDVLRKMVESMFE